MIKKTGKTRNLVQAMFRNSFLTRIIILTATTLGVVIDGIFIGRGLGVESVKAYGFASPLSLLVTAISGLFSAGCQTTSMNSLGKGDNETSREYFATAFFDVLFVSVMTAVLFLVCSRRISGMLGAEGEYLQMTADYISGFSIGLPALLISGVFLPLLQVEGKNRYIGISIVLMTLVNFIGDYVVISLMDGGLFEMGLTTSISSYVSMIMVVAYYLSEKAFFKIDVRRFHFRHNKDILISGLPTLALRVSKSLNAATLNLILVGIGSAIGVAALSIEGNIVLLFCGASSAVGLSAVPIAAALYGERNKTGLVELLSYSLKIGILITGSISAILFVGAGSFVRIFLKDQDAWEASVRCLRLAALGQPFLVFNVCLENIYQGMKKRGLSITLRILEAFGFISLSAFILSRFFGETGVFLGLPVGECLTTLTILGIAAVRKKSLKLTWADLLRFDGSFSSESEHILEKTVVRAEELSGVLSELRSFLRDRDITEENIEKCVLIAEEICSNTIEHGFGSEKDMVELRVTFRDQGITLRLRDNCRKFDPVAYWSSIETADKEKNIGLRIVMSTAKNITYSNIIKMNNLIIEF